MTGRERARYGQEGRRGCAKLQWQDMAWPDMASYLAHDDRVLVVVGSCEQHGPHLCFATDTLVPAAIARRAGEAVGVPVTPALAFGMSEHHLAFPGTISLTPSTFMAVVGDVLTSLWHHGFHRVVVVNGHGGNQAPLAMTLATVANRLDGLRVKVYSWWKAPAVTAAEIRLFGQEEHHAGAAETSAILALHPAGVTLSRAAAAAPQADTEFVTASRWRRLYPVGAAGPDPRLATAEAGEELLAAATAELVAELEHWPE